MSIQVTLRHVTRYRYDRAVSLSPQVVRLRPAPHARTPILGYSLRISPEKHFRNWQQDPQGNWQARITVPEKVREFAVEVSLTADMVVFNPFDFFLEPYAESFPFAYEEGLARELRPFLELDENSELVDEFVESVPKEAARTVDFLVDLNRKLYERIRYLIRLEPGVQSPHETLEKGSGSCRDSAWLLVQVLRRLGLAARFASGYLVQLALDQKSLDGPSGPAADFTDLHAWCEVFLPGAGWVGLDPTSGLLAGEGHIPLACTPEPSSAAPISGGVEPCEVAFDFEMSVMRLPEAPRSTKPYSDKDWKAIEALGHVVDESLERGDVRLTMGGEPTFISVDDYDGAEWNTVALGDRKRVLAGSLLCRLRDRFAPRGYLHFGQGKQYPGESLPRWAFSCTWRKDGQPVWRDESLVASEETKYRYTNGDAQIFLTRLSHVLGVGTSHMMAGYEDAWYWLWRERRLPTNVDPLAAPLDDPEERARLSRVLLHSVVGWALPLRYKHGWESGHWFLRREHLFLIPGDSPMGYRLPLDSLPWAAPSERFVQMESDPFETLPALPASILNQPRLLAEGSAGTTHKTPDTHPSPAQLVRTALCVEARKGVLCVFMPPMFTAESWLMLVEAVEETARQLNMPVRCEGYPPPRDNRLDSFAITPDPGVIEVNVHPSKNWKDCVYITNTIYEEARLCRLGTEKFLVDGRRAGTGGGNHIVLGGKTPSDSPFLRRPDLLRSLVTHWLNHPSLSYLFSGLFVGPTSQSPRVDEARNDAVHELELAFAELDKATLDYRPVAPWLVDRALRHILADATGNTHRTEFCIDKLYSPDSSSGRLGLVELRSFEMPPHPRMSLAQQLLVRALVARFWSAPSQATPVRWGNQLHDQWMLPRLIWDDLGEVLTDLQEHGFAFSQEWFRPHLEFRFPLLGAFGMGTTQVELRTALEPWHVLGEEASAAGTVRYVDSSVERVQVLVRNATPGRHSVLCNGRRLPLQPTGTAGECIAAVRYRAWQPPSCLHPTIGVHTPLVFDLYDEWAGKAVTGCTYHVMHPGGRAYDRLPVNSYEAESRRFERFQTMGYTQDSFEPAPALTRPESPLTLDLRWE